MFVDNNIGCVQEIRCGVDNDTPNHVTPSAFLPLLPFLQILIHKEKKITLYFLVQSDRLVEPRKRNIAHHYLQLASKH